MLHSCNASLNSQGSSAGWICSKKKEHHEILHKSTLLTDFILKAEALNDFLKLCSEQFNGWALTYATLCPLQLILH